MINVLKKDIIAKKINVRFGLPLLFSTLSAMGRFAKSGYGHPRLPSSLELPYS